jgi:hypothetical protein
MAADKRLYVKWSAGAGRRPHHDMNKLSFLATATSAIWHQVSGLTYGPAHG